MEERELLKRAEDLSRRCAGRWEITQGVFLTPAERLMLEKKFRPEDGSVMRFSGGYEEAERRVLFFLPEGEEDSSTQEHLCAVHYHAFFGEPGHRDYLGALLASGISRDRLGDILLQGADAWVFCLPGVLSHLLMIERIGRISVRAEEVSLGDVPIPEKRREESSFSVQSLRLDAVAAGIFHLSRSHCAELIRQGLLSLNYEECTRVDAPVEEGDVLSLRGHGKGRLVELGGMSRKGRQFITAERYL